MKLILALVLDFMINLGALALSYPVWQRFAFHRYPVSYWWEVYLWAAILSTIVVSIVGIAVIALSRSMGEMF